MQTHSSRGPRCWKTRSQAARGRGWSDPAAKGRVSGSGLRGGGLTTCRSNCGGRGGGAGPRGQLSSGPPLPGRIARRPPRFSFSPELPRAGRRPFRASPGASSSLSDVPDESESESESEDEEEVSGTRSSSWHIRLKRSSFSLCGDGDGTAGPSAEAIGGFGFCKETGEAVLGSRVHFPNHSPKRSQQRMTSPRVRVSFCSHCYNLSNYVTCAQDLGQSHAGSSVSKSSSPHHVTTMIITGTFSKHKLPATHYLI